MGKQRKEQEEVLGDNPEYAGVETIKYFIKCRNDEFMIEIPRHWKITFAAVNPASNHANNGHCVRVYEQPGNHLRAVYDGAVSIRDMSIPMARKVKSEMGSASWNKDSFGNFTETISVIADEKFLPEGGGF